MQVVTLGPVCNATDSVCVYLTKSDSVRTVYLTKSDSVRTDYLTKSDFVRTLDNIRKGT
jgi:hypothetical protein